MLLSRFARCPAFLPVVLLVTTPGCGGRLALKSVSVSSGGDDAGVAAEVDAEAGTPGTASSNPPPGTIWASDDGPILGLAISDDRVFVVTQGKLTSVAPDGGDVVVLAQSTGPFPYTGAIAVNAQTVYWGTPGDVSSLPLDGGQSTTTTNGSVEGYNTTAIALDDAGVYWVSNDAVLSTSLAGGPPAQLATLDGISYGSDLALSQGTLYWSTNSDVDELDAGGIFQMPAGGGTPVIIGAGPVFSLETTADGVAWLEDPSPVIVDTPTGQMAQQFPLSGWVNEFAGDGTNWYWRDEGTGVLYVLAGPNAVPRALTQPVRSLANNGNGRHILVEHGVLIWADREGSTSPSPPEVDVLRVLDL